MEHEPSFKFSLADIGALRYNTIILTTRADEETIWWASCAMLLTGIASFLFFICFQFVLVWAFLWLFVFHSLIVSILVIVCISLSHCEQFGHCLYFTVLMWAFLSWFVSHCLMKSFVVFVISLWVWWPLKKPYRQYPCVSSQMLLSFCPYYIWLSSLCLLQLYIQSHDRTICLLVLLLYKNSSSYILIILYNNSMQLF